MEAKSGQGSSTGLHEDRALERAAYTDPAVLELEKERLFYRSWLYACHESQVSEAGAFVTLQVFDQEILLVRGEDGRLRAFQNVCLHRGHPLAEGAGKAQRFVCPYHAWTYDLAGQLIGIPGLPDGPPERLCLPEVRVERLLCFYFINLDKAAPKLEEQAAGLAESLKAALPDLESYRLQPAARYIGDGFACNWKVVMDNFLECYHCQPAHPSFSQLLDVSKTYNRIAPYWMHQNIPLREGMTKVPYPLSPEDDVLEGDFWFLFPNHIIARVPGRANLSISRVDPVGAETASRFIQSFSPHLDHREADAARTAWLRDGVIAEDRKLCEAVQRGMRQKGFTKGYYVHDEGRHDRSEETLWAFHRRYEKVMGSGDGVS